MAKTWKDQRLNSKSGRRSRYSRKNERQFRNKWKQLDWQKLDVLDEESEAADEVKNEEYV